MISTTLAYLELIFFIRQNRIVSSWYWFICPLHMTTAFLELLPAFWLYCWHCHCWALILCIVYMPIIRFHCYDSTYHFVTIYAAMTLNHIKLYCNIFKCLWYVNWIILNKYHSAFVYCNLKYLQLALYSSIFVDIFDVFVFIFIWAIMLANLHTIQTHS